MIATLLQSAVLSISSCAWCMIAQTNTSAIPKEAYRRASSLTMMFAILSILLIMILAFVVITRRSKRRKDAQPKPVSTEHIDAWAEAGRRLDDSFIELDIDDDD